MQTTNLFIQPDGRLQFVYDDELAELLAIGAAEIERGGFVEPYNDGSWMVVSAFDPQGPVIDGPFPTRQEALRYEREHVEGALAQGCFYGEDENSDRGVGDEEAGAVPGEWLPAESGVEAGDVRSAHVEAFPVPQTPACQRRAWHP